MYRVKVIRGTDEKTRAKGDMVKLGLFAEIKVFDEEKGKVVIDFLDLIISNRYLGP